MNFRLKYEDEAGELRTATVEAPNLAVAKVDGLKKLIYHMVTDERPGQKASIREWAEYLIPEPHLSRFLLNVADNPSTDDYLLIEAIGHFGVEEEDAWSVDHTLRKKIVDNAFGWSNSNEQSDDYWEFVYEGNFEKANEWILKHVTNKNRPPGSYSIPA